MSILFSVIIPVYNAEKYLTKCIDSVIHQRFDDLELIIIDDFSNDNTRKILKLYAKKNNNIKVFFNRKNKGVAFTRNVGLKKSSGKYLVFLDSDDFLFKNTFRNLKKIIINKKYPDAIFVKYKKEIYPFNNSKILDKSNKVLKPEDLIKLINKNNFPVEECWQFIINKNFLDSNKLKFVDIKMAEDQLFVAEILTKMQSCACYNKFFYYHKNVSNSLSTSLDLQNDAKSYLVLLVGLVKLYKIKLNSPENKLFLENYIQNVYGILFSYLFVLKKRELFIFNSIFLKNRNLLMNVKKKPENVSLKDIANKSSPSKLINTYIDEIFLFKKNQIMKNNIKYKYIFIYCTGIASLATINILKKIKLTPHRIIEDNLEIVHKKFYGIKISSLDQINQDFNIKTLNKSLFLVSNQKNDTFNKISKAILKLGCFQDQIIHIKF